MNGIHIVAVEVKDFHRLSVAEIEHVPTVLNAVSGALGGTGKILPDFVNSSVAGCYAQ